MIFDMGNNGCVKFEVSNVVVQMNRTLRVQIGNFKCRSLENFHQDENENVDV